ncbi:MAG TPA: BLUF domain-containing protein, partial [Hymenobacter sp.]
LVYSSVASTPLTEEELQRQLLHWRDTNAALGVTGVLLYSEGNIMQVLEGAAEVIHRLYDTIAADIRHRSVTKLADGPVQGRAFTNWSMRFRTVETADFAHFVQQASAAPKHARGLLPLLEAFLSPEPHI